MAQFTPDTRILGYYRGVYDTDYKVDFHPYHTLNGVTGFRSLDPVTDLDNVYNKRPNSKFNFNYVRTNHYDANIKYTHFQMRIRYESRPASLKGELHGFNYSGQIQVGTKDQYFEHGPVTPFVHVCYDLLAGPPGAQYYDRKYALSVAVGNTGGKTNAPTSANIRIAGVPDEYLNYMVNTAQSRTLTTSRDDRICATIYAETVLGVTKHYAEIKNLENDDAVVAEIPNTVALNNFYVMVNNNPGGFFTYVAWMGYNNLEDHYEYDLDGLGNVLVTYNWWCDSTGVIWWEAYGDGYGYNSMSVSTMGQALINATSTENMFETVLGGTDNASIMHNVTTGYDEEGEIIATINYAGYATSPAIKLNTGEFWIDKVLPGNVGDGPGEFAARCRFGLIRDYIIYQSDDAAPQDVDTEVIELGPVTNLYCMDSSYTGLGEYFKQGLGNTYAEKLARIQADGMTLDYLGGAFIGRVYMGVNLHTELPAGATVAKLAMSYRTGGYDWTTTPPIPDCTVSNAAMIYSFQTFTYDGATSIKNHHVITNVNVNNDAVVKIKLIEQGT